MWRLSFKFGVGRIIRPSMLLLRNTRLYIHPFSVKVWFGLQTPTLRLQIQWRIHSHPHPPSMLNEVFRSDPKPRTGYSDDIICWPRVKATQSWLLVEWFWGFALRIRYMWESKMQKFVCTKLWHFMICQWNLTRKI